jgi:cell division protein FtsI/penicillin-binding protein 2
VGLRLGGPAMHAAAGEFGFGRNSGVGLPGESAGIVRPLASWNHYSLTSIPMGQEIAVTPIQLVKAFSAFANGGMMATPTLLADEADDPIFEHAIDERTADLTRRVLREVVTDGTGRRARSTRYRIWGKTGTAEIPDRVHGGYIEDGFVASFVCGAPLRNPRLIVAVIVHHPDRAIGHYGGTVAAPPAKSIVEQTLAYLGVPPDGEEAVPPPDLTPQLVRRTDR